MKIKVLGTGCPNCKRLEENVRKAVRELGLKGEVASVTDIEKIAAYGITSTPALAINEEVVLYGRVPNVGELKEIISGFV